VSAAAIPSAIRRKWGHPGWVIRRLIHDTFARIGHLGCAMDHISPSNIGEKRIFVTAITAAKSASSTFTLAKF